MSLKGNKCSICGVEVGTISDGCFHFHHNDPNSKEISIGSHRGKKADIIKEVVEKCSLQCCRCHTSTHSGKLTKCRQKCSSM